MCTGREVTPWVTEEELLNPCFPLDKRYAAVSGKHTKIDPEWPISRGFYISRITMTNGKMHSFRADYRGL